MTSMHHSTHRTGLVRLLTGFLALVLAFSGVPAGAFAENANVAEDVLAEELESPSQNVEQVDPEVLPEEPAVELEGEDIVTPEEQEQEPETNAQDESTPEATAEDQALTVDAVVALVREQCGEEATSRDYATRAAELVLESVRFDATIVDEEEHEVDAEAVLAGTPSSARDIAEVLHRVFDGLEITNDVLVSQSEDAASATWNAVLIDDAWLHVDLAAQFVANEEAANTETEPLSWQFLSTDELVQRDATRQPWQAVYGVWVAPVEEEPQEEVADAVSEPEVEEVVSLEAKPEEEVVALEDPAPSIEDATITNIGKQAYTGKPIKPSPKVTYNDVTLVKDTDYTLTYANNTKPGTASVTITGKGSYTGSVTKQFKIVAPTVTYRTHVQRVGWQGWKKNGAVAGTSGRSLRLEGINIKLTNKPVTGGITYRTHVQKIGWQNWKSNGVMSGTEGLSLRLEAIQIKLTGNMAKKYDVYYRVHCQKFGWMGWAKNGGKSGSSGLALRLEAIQIKLVPKGAAAPGATSNAFVAGENIGKLGWQNPSGLYQVSRKSVTITSAARYPWNYVTPSRIGVWATRSECVNAFVQRAREYLGTPYMWNYSCAPGVGVDCVGLVFQCAYACGMDMGPGVGYNDFNPWAHYSTGVSGWHSHDANNMWSYGKVQRLPLSARQYGDCISWAGHIAIYVGNDTIIEAYPGMGVGYNSLYAHGSPRGCLRFFA